MNGRKKVDTGKGRTKEIATLSMIMLMLFSVFAIAPVAAQDTIAGSRTISPTTVAPGDTFTVTVDVDITGTVYGPLLNESLPAGWTITEVDNAGAAHTTGTTKWLWSGAQTTDKTVIYNVTVPTDATPGSYPVTGTVLATVAGETIGPFTVTGDDRVTVDAISPTREFIPPTPADGLTITVNYMNVTVNVADPSAVSTVLLNGNGVNETMYMIANNTWSVNKTGLSNGDYTFKVYANDTVGNMGVSETRAVTVNVTDWNPWDDDGEITDTEISLAEYRWATSTPINGHVVTDSEISLLEYQWATGSV